MTKLTRRLLPAAIAVALIVTARPAPAQDAGIEITPTIGYRVGGTASTFNSSYIQNLKVPDTLSFGLTIEKSVNPNGTVEFLWSHQDTELRIAWVGAPPSGYSNRLSHLNIDTFQLGGLYETGRRGDRVRGYIDLLLGVSVVTPAPQYSTLTRFSASIGGGAKVAMSDRLGARFGVRFMPIYINSTGSGYVSCSPYYGCYEYYNTNYLYQWDFHAGLILKF
jgi:hypothetical protein